LGGGVFELRQLFAENQLNISNRTIAVFGDFNLDEVTLKRVF
jgi:hypothetical protein